MTCTHDTFPGTLMFTCTRHLASFSVLVGLLSDNPEPTCPDPKVWDEVDPSAEDRVFLVEQVDQQ